MKHDDDHSPTPGRRLAALLSAAALLLPAALLASCSSELKLVLAENGSATLDLELSVPEPVASKLAAYRAPEDAKAPLFDAEAVRKGGTARGAKVLSAVAPDRRSFKGGFSAASVPELLKANPELARSGLLAYSEAEGVARLELRITRENARVLPGLFPGIDPYLLEALSPPAFDGPPVTAAEYRSMLSALLGTASMPAVDGSAVRISIRVPGEIVEREGGTVSGKTLSASIPVVEALVLEKPVAIRVAWRR